jgi:hypothetical protein
VDEALVFMVEDEYVHDLQLGKHSHHLGTIERLDELLAVLLQQFQLHIIAMIVPLSPVLAVTDLSLFFRFPTPHLKNYDGICRGPVLEVSRRSSWFPRLDILNHGTVPKSRDAFCYFIQNRILCLSAFVPFHVSSAF